MKPSTFFFLAGFCLILLTACQEPDDANTPANQTPTQVALLPTTTPSLTPSPTLPPSYTPTPIPSTFTPSHFANTPFTQDDPDLDYRRTPTPVIPTPRPTPFPDILLTPDAPLPDVTYRLADWSPELANHQALLMQGYEQLIGYFYSTPTESIYYNSFVHEALAYQEALLRYPDDPQALKWRLGMIANLAISGDSSADQLYRKLIVDALNQGEITLEENALRNWFHTYPSDYEIGVEAVPPPPGYLGSYIISIFGGYNIGGTIFWLLETSDGFISYSVQNNLGTVFSAINSFIVADLTHDDILDLAIYEGAHSGTMRGGRVAVYDLSRVPPIRLSFGPQPSWLISSSQAIESTIELDQRYLLVYSEDPVFCPASYVSWFIWNGQWFEQTKVEIDYWGDEFGCIDILNKDWIDLSNIEREAMLKMQETKIGDVQPSGNDWRTGNDYLPDAQDEFRYIIAMNHSLLGQNAETIDYLTRITNTPAITTSQWIEPAQTFLAHYETAEDVYPACKAVGDYCNWRLALGRTVASLPLTRYESYLTDLAALDVTILTNGIFDFDNDMAHEHWFIVRHQPDAEAELWVLAQSNDGLKAMFVETVQDLNPTFLIYSNGSESLYSYRNGSSFFTMGTDELFVFVRRLQDREPYITKINSWEPWSYEQTPLSTITNALLDGADPAQSVIALNALAAEADFEPSSEYYYYLGLAYELSGDEVNALNAYLQAWQACCDTWSIFNEITLISPYAMLARGRVEPVP